MRTIIFLLIFSLFINGCYSLRKKFVRKKQYKEEPVYVDFKTYPDVPSKDLYYNYYLLVIGWVDDLKDSLLGIENSKRQKRAIDEAIRNLEQCMAFLNQDGKEKIYPLYKELVDIKKDIYSGYDKLKKNFILSKIEHFKKNFQSDFSYSKVQDFFIE